MSTRCALLLETVGYAARKRLSHAMEKRSMYFFIVNFVIWRFIMKNSPHSNWKPSLAHILSVHIRFNADGSTSSHATRDKYSDVLFAGFRRLNELGFKITDVKNFRGKHMEVLAKDWEKQYHEGKLSASTIQNRISIFRNFANWIGKRGMVERSHQYVSPECIRRTSINTVDKSWQAKGIDPQEKFGEVYRKDPWVALQLTLQATYGMRAREALQFRPHLADKGGYLELTQGTREAGHGQYQSIPLIKGRCLMKPSAS
jgi:hypothetical protein